MANLSKTRTVFGFTSPRTIVKKYHIEGLDKEGLNFMDSIKLLYTIKKRTRKNKIGEPEIFVHIIDHNPLGVELTYKKVVEKIEISEVWTIK